jgi:hypothetical protein
LLPHYAAAMNTRTAILTRIERFLAAHDMSESRFGMLVCKDHKLVDRLRRESVTLARIEAAEAFMDRYDREPPKAAPSGATRVQA